MHAKSKDEMTTNLCKIDTIFYTVFATGTNFLFKNIFFFLQKI